MSTVYRSIPPAPPRARCARCCRHVSANCAPRSRQRARASDPLRVARGGPPTAAGKPRPRVENWRHRRAEVATRAMAEPARSGEALACAWRPGRYGQCRDELTDERCLGCRSLRRCSCRTCCCQPLASEQGASAARLTDFSPAHERSVTDAPRQITSAAACPRTASSRRRAAREIGWLPCRSGGRFIATITSIGPQAHCVSAVLARRAVVTAALPRR